MIILLIYPKYLGVGVLRNSLSRLGPSQEYVCTSNKYRVRYSESISYTNAPLTGHHHNNTKEHATLDIDL